MTAWQTLAPGMGRLARNVLRVVRPGGGTTVPGWVALRLDPHFVSRTAARADLRIVITGTNGKTSTMSLLRHFLEQDGSRVVANEEGANLRQGIAAALLGGAGDAVVMEVDEAAFPKLAPELDPHLVIVTGLFRDQLDRFGEVQTTRRHLERAILGLPRATLLLNGDDPLVASLAQEGRSVFFRAALPAMAEVPSDTPACPRCGGELAYAERYYAHLGRFRCTRCGFANPDTAFEATLTEGALRMGDTALPSLPPYLHPYSVTAAVAAALWLGRPPHLEAWPRAAGGRGETRTVEGRRVSLALVKNPASMSWNLAQAPASAHVFLINDGAADGVDVSWLWDARYGDVLRKVTVSGSRAMEFMVRLRYLSSPPEATAYAAPEEAVAAAVRAVPEGDSVLVLSTYTNLKRANLLLREALPAALPEPMRLPGRPGGGAGGAPLAPPPAREAGTAPSQERARGSRTGEPPVRIAWLYPDQMGTYGDGGNLTVLRSRLEWRGRDAEVVRLDVGDAMPTDVEAVVIGGGEDLAQGLVMDDLRRHGPDLRARFDDGVVGLLVCGGYQLLGETFEVGGRTLQGLGLLPVTTVAGAPRLVGRLLVESALSGGPLVGFENHGGRTHLHGGVPLGRVLQGHGNDEDGAAGEGVVAGHVVGTYLHGPVLARNPNLADRLLAWIGERRGWSALEPLDDHVEREASRRLMPAGVAAARERASGRRHARQRRDRRASP